MFRQTTRRCGWGCRTTDSKLCPRPPFQAGQSFARQLDTSPGPDLRDDRAGITEFLDSSSPSLERDQLRTGATYLPSL